MILRVLVLLIFVLAIAPARAVEEGSQPAPGFFSRLLHTRPWHIFHHDAEQTTTKPHTTRTKHLAIGMELSPLPLKLSENRLLKVRLTLTNKSNRFVQLEFPTTQRIEILIRD